MMRSPTPANAPSEPSHADVPREEEERLLDMGMKAALGLLDKSDMGPMDRATVATMLTRCFDAYAALRTRVDV